MYSIFKGKIAHTVTMKAFVGQNKPIELTVHSNMKSAYSDIF